ncbi:MAG: hypothetical protein KAG99_05505 [Bacteroidales bacterium]|nr:hypothetical protein [Bacteroidales bacterium]
MLENASGHTNTSATISFSNNLMYVDDDDCENRGTYEYALSEATLSLIAIDDDCDPRVIALQGIWHEK